MNQWATPGLDLHLDLSGGHGVRDGLEKALREAVRSGRLTPGTRLPSSRVLAQDLGLARNTVADAYGQLVAEGWLTARQGAGTRVSEATFAYVGRTSSVPEHDRSAPSRPSPTYRYDLRPGSPDLSSFPREAWLTSTRRALALAPHEALGYIDPRGRPELRHTLAEYLARARGVRVSQEQIVVCSGFAQGIGLLGRTIVRSGGSSIAVEALGLPSARDVLRNMAGLETVDVPVDADGVCVEQLADEDALLFTPSHQFPTGVALPPARRAAAIAWARERGSLLVEDDYDGEFRYDRQPVGAVQGLAPDRVVYAGTTSKSLAPGLRLGWLVLPSQLVEPIVVEKQLADRHTSAIDQLALADFISSGAYDRHVRRMRSEYRRRRDLLIAAVTRDAPQVQVTGIAAGLHAVLQLPRGGPSETEVIEAARRRGLALTGLASFGEQRSKEGLVVGYATPPGHAFAGAVEQLCGVLGAQSDRRSNT